MPKDRKRQVQVSTGNGSSNKATDKANPRHAVSPLERAIETSHAGGPPVGPERGLVITYDLASTLGSDSVREGDGPTHIGSHDGGTIEEGQSISTGRQAQWRKAIQAVDRPFILHERTKPTSTCVLHIARPDLYVTEIHYEWHQCKKVFDSPRDLIQHLIDKHGFERPKDILKKLRGILLEPVRKQRRGLCLVCFAAFGDVGEDNSIYVHEQNHIDRSDKVPRDSELTSRKFNTMLNLFGNREQTLEVLYVEYTWMRPSELAVAGEDVTDHRMTEAPATPNTRSIRRGSRDTQSTGIVRKDPRRVARRTRGNSSASSANQLLGVPPGDSRASIDGRTSHSEQFVEVRRSGSFLEPTPIGLPRQSRDDAPSVSMSHMDDETRFRTRTPASDTIQSTDSYVYEDPGSSPLRAPYYGQLSESTPSSFSHASPGFPAFSSAPAEAQPGADIHGVEEMEVNYSMQYEGPGIVHEMKSSDENTP
ncbi:hypothetical protein NA57DRAFT_79691 [Rhizodiscina lignyota]|uniref:Uncharacterized protein n=1 Tax=Rhizodiscina lignyota TaxID=1504668 RepID=A0A9P4M313_9PEZI|nr:hypothetical protein NA57DRAFT_79691 [Rhizodiscina lignyota]